MLEESTKLLQPREHKAKICIWNDLTVADMDRVDETGSPEQLKGLLRELFRLEDPSINPRDGVLLDLYFYTLQFAQDSKFSKEQTSAFFSIIKATHAVCTETPFGNVQQCFNYFREMVLCHAVKRPPFSIDLFAAEEVRKITEYTINTYFRHYKLYKYVFTPLVRLDLSMTYIGMPETPAPSEAGDEAEEGGEEKGDEPEKAVETEEQEVEVTPSQVESPAASELRAIIKNHLSAELVKVKTDMEDQLKQSEQNLNKMLEGVETGGQKSGRSSAKGKKK